MPREKRAAPRAGTITTFFSFKGGVGRSMALANCAFLAAMNGKRVLVMDWDLEAPGLPYYFRGLIDQRGAAKIRKAPGVLDLFWGWRVAVEKARTAADLDERIARYRNHEAFRSCVNPLIEPRRLPGSARLDVMTAGSANIRCPESMGYAEALSRFSWSSFFEDYAGGNLIHELRRWCRAQYDLILIDSRTGLADVAGICTMQIPDSVYLCFVFNRQNIEGSAQVARSIIAARGEDIKVRVVPMRVSKERPSEEADARARASREFRRAGLPVARVEDDLANLAVPASAAIPYYEALAPFTSSDHIAGDLNWAYLRMTQELLGQDVPRFRLDPTWSEEVRARLQPAIVTVEYLRELENADPDRALDEISRYLDGAIDADPSLEIDPEYVRALVAATIEIIDSAYDEDEGRYRKLEDKALRLIEQMHAIGDGDWREDFVNAAEEFSFRADYSIEEHARRLERQERILADGPQDRPTLLRRAITAVLRARVARDMGDVDAALVAAEQAEDLARQAAAIDRTGDELRYIRASVADVRARAALDTDPDYAREQFGLLLKEAEATSDVRTRNMAAEAHLALADRGTDDARRRMHLLAAIELQPRRFLRDIERLSSALPFLLEGEGGADVALRVGKALFGDTRSNRTVPFGKNTDSALQFARIANQLVRALSSVEPTESAPIYSGIGESAARVLAQWLRRKQPEQVEEGAADKLSAAYEALTDRLQIGGLSARQAGRLRDMLAQVIIVSARDHDDDDDG